MQICSRDMGEYNDYLNVPLVSLLNYHQRENRPRILAPFLKLVILYLEFVFFLLVLYALLLSRAHMSKMK